MAPRQIAIALHHRDRFSEGHMRRVFGYEAFHWAVMITPGQSQERDCWTWTFDATDATEIDPATFRMINPTMDWWFRDEENGDPELRPKLVGIVVLGTAPDDMSFLEAKGILSAVPLPVKNRHPQQSCVTWAENAIGTLQRQGWVRDFNIGQFKDWALAYADERLKGEDSRQPKVVQYRLAQT